MQVWTQSTYTSVSGDETLTDNCIVRIWDDGRIQIAYDWYDDIPVRYTGIINPNGYFNLVADNFSGTSVLIRKEEDLFSGTWKEIHDNEIIEGTWEITLDGEKII